MLFKIIVFYLKPEYELFDKNCIFKIICMYYVAMKRRKLEPNREENAVKNTHYDTNDFYYHSLQLWTSKDIYDYF